jgi:hypothetical protein
VQADLYDSFAESYSRENESSLFNRYYERPAMIDLAGDVKGHQVLDAGCGSGPLSAALREKGAIDSPASTGLRRISMVCPRIMQRDHTGLELLHIIVHKSDSEKGNLQ